MRNDSQTNKEGPIMLEKEIQDNILIAKLTDKKTNAIDRHTLGQLKGV